MTGHTATGLYLTGGDTAGYVLEDGSRLEVTRRTRDWEGRTAYRWSVRAPVTGPLDALTLTPLDHGGVLATLETGRDLHTGVSMDRGPVPMLETLCSFLSATAEHYRATMAPDPEDSPGGFGAMVQEWAYMHDDELSMIGAELAERGE